MTSTPQLGTLKALAKIEGFKNDLNRLERLILSFVAGDFFDIREDE